MTLPKALYAYVAGSPMGSHIGKCLNCGTESAQDSSTACRITKLSCVIGSEQESKVSCEEIDDGGKHDWYCHYCGGEKPRGEMCVCRHARLHGRIEVLERTVLGMHQNAEHTRCTKTDSNGVQCEVRGPHEFHNADKALKEFLDRNRRA